MHLSCSICIDHYNSIISMYQILYIVLYIDYTIKNTQTIGTFRHDELFPSKSFIFQNIEFLSIILYRKNYLRTLSCKINFAIDYTFYLKYFVLILYNQTINKALLQHIYKDLKRHIFPIHKQVIKKKIIFADLLNFIAYTVFRTHGVQMTFSRK